MTKYTVRATTSSPEIHFDPMAMPFEIRGESYPENCRAFYGPMFEWLERYFNHGSEDVVEIDMRILYFNSSSSKTFMDFFDLLDEQACKGKKIVVNWWYHEENESAMECGEEFMEDVEKIKFNLVEYTDK
ncbi:MULTISPECIES: DUF1987 domain-containing protein [unclassified Pseudodesulfovibrio]|uniref:DUF1987 domain-containing protein n=1 Tax=unclassified Pseudodesulfovibrio TaxID=2661612 RepID=UPI000FEBAB15|nr:MULTISPECIES: DUF1987 domain-containing protein [unclassified Pseudodesulfovibrio]MCJ2163373.1 DUF1987 domain-containing protein [Pseudodesulfovibrio sp. S3-i]RWU06612.1 DUF1987 domain-containing protein [Pseudodesulfovibrio sp. S3]